MGIALTAPGTRHDAMMKIAVYQRHTGATREENQSALEEWYARQPEELIGSTPEEVQRDISGILDWVYSDRFTAARRMVRDSTAVSETQMDIVLNQWSRSSRRIVFLLLVRTRLGQPRISAADIGKATGISVRTVYDVIHKLVDSEVIIRTEGRRTQLPDKTYSAECCSYVLPHKAG